MITIIRPAEHLKVHREKDPLCVFLKIADADPKDVYLVELDGDTATARIHRFASKADGHIRRIEGTNEPERLPVLEVPWNGEAYA